MELKINEINWGDCLELLPTLKSEIIDLAIIDPPYNINIDEWDNIGNLNEYIYWFENIINEIFRVVRKNGSIYIFGDFKYIADIKVMMNKKDVSLISWIVWDKGTKSQNSTRSYVNVTEHCLFYVKNVKKDLSIPTELNTVRDYLRNEKNKSGITNKQFNLMYSNFYNKNGCVNRSVIEHYFSEKQWEFPTEEIYKNILQSTGFFNKNYLELKKEYENLIYTFNVDDIRIPRNPKDKRNFKNENQLLTNVWYYNNKYEMGIYDHKTVKPIDMIKTIIKASSNKNDLVLDCFSGSGTTGVACKELDRDFICIEKEYKNVKMSKNRINNIKEKLNTKNLF